MHIKTTLLGQKVKARRGEMTMRDLGQTLDLSHSMIHRVEKGEMPSPGAFIKLVAWLGEIDGKNAERLTQLADPTKKS